MNFQDLVLKNRSYRKFHASEIVSEQSLASLIDLARKTPSSKNIQPLKYILAVNKGDTDFIFQQLAWAKHLADWKGPENHERPPAYIIMLMDKKLNENALIDAGIAAQTILLGATQVGLGGCIIRTVDRVAVRKHFQLPEHLEIIQVIAIGKPAQEVRLTSMDEKGDYHYFQEQGIHYVPKRSLKEIIYKTGE
jgi:nitroreductase